VSDAYGSVIAVPNPAGSLPSSMFRPRSVRGELVAVGSARAFLPCTILCWERGMLAAAVDAGAAAAGVAVTAAGADGDHDAQLAAMFGGGGDKVAPLLDARTRRRLHVTLMPTLRNAASRMRSATTAAPTTAAAAAAAVLGAASSGVGANSLAPAPDSAAAEWDTASAGLPPSSWILARMRERSLAATHAPGIGALTPADVGRRKSRRR